MGRPSPSTHIPTLSSLRKKRKRTKRQTDGISKSRIAKDNYPLFYNQFLFRFEQILNIYSKNLPFLNKGLVL